ncbi:MAG: hypothetical protein O2839_06815 [Cyanobacteria bacterium]|nr:hypothetical protein [Cyanobacteriota bacterium]MDA1246625.1 hypothetical protein [Cyanobacteriota bacterium]
MSHEGESSVKSLIEQAGKNQELQYGTNKDRLRIDLRIDDIELWQAHHASHPGNPNLLLACEKSTGEIANTNLTWVVGAAIRSELVANAAQAMEILKKLGVSEQLIKLASKHCPGLGITTIWAFHLERHGWLTATPVKSWE